LRFNSKLCFCYACRHDLVTKLTSSFEQGLLYGLVLATLKVCTEGLKQL
jgi:hypothetical protein